MFTMPVAFSVTIITLPATCECIFMELAFEKSCCKQRKNVLYGTYIGQLERLETL